MSDQACTRLMTFTFRVRQRYFDAIVAGTKTVEYRRDIRFWQLRISHAVPMLGCEVFSVCDFFSTEKYGVWNLAKAIFICGKQNHRVWLKKIERIKTPDYFSEQGKKDVDTSTCLAFHLGDKIDE